MKKLTVKEDNQNTTIPILQKGTYILILCLNSDKKIQIGKLGNFDFKKGYYAYVGSAFGPGGLSARLKHHLKIADNPHWHVDYLRKEAMLREIWVSEHEKHLEHEWAAMLRYLADTSVPVPGFGSSDCHCEAHLIYFKSKPRF